MSSREPMDRECSAEDLLCGGGKGEMSVSLASRASVSRRRRLRLLLGVVRSFLEGVKGRSFTDFSSTTIGRKEGKRLCTGQRRKRATEEHRGGGVVAAATGDRRRVLTFAVVHGEAREAVVLDRWVFKPRRYESVDRSRADFLRNPDFLFLFLFNSWHAARISMGRYRKQSTPVECVYR
ncbi:hypothetical protein CRUP_009940 [Coryphaenoides rupestris]|nr:hypothetical protein CRUP_009940 [Coryphaenoides rupestris]